MICKKCGSEVAEDDVFCMQCGEKIERPQCPHCGAEVDEDTVFCSNCGEKIGQERCPYCGSELEEDSKFCVFCGAKTDGTESAKQQTTNASLVGIVVVVFDSGAAEWFERKKEEQATIKAIEEALAEMEDEEWYEEEYLWESEDFDDYLGNWVAYLDNGKPIYFEIWKDAGKYWFSMDASTPSVVLYSTAEITYIDEDLGLASGESEDEYYYLGAVFDFMDGAMIASAQIIEKTSDYDLELEDLECQPWTAADEAVLNEYIFPESHFQYLKKWELEGLSKEELKIARNEIYARHGRMFQDDSLQAYFNSCSWYTPSIAPEDFKESMLNEVEIENRDLIVSYEKEMGYR